MLNEELSFGDWINYIDTDKLEILPIQFANALRIKKNDVVYLFDEVGAGKTISLGIMALEYLSNNRDKDILIITTNSLVIKESDLGKGQFLNDWLDKLPFRELNYTEKIKIINNHSANIKKVYNNMNDKFGMIIVDEAHLFLNKFSQRTKALKKLKAEKLVLATASPIKESNFDLDNYVNIAKEIIQTNGGNRYEFELSSLLRCENKDESEIICSQFDINLPVTRYFKNTVLSLANEGSETYCPKRSVPQVWEYEKLDDKPIELVKNIKRILQDSINDNKNDRFIIFTRYKEKEVEIIKDELNKAKFKMFDFNKDKNNEFTYYSVTGDNNEELSLFAGVDKKVPNVLIVTYQIAEQGVNFPAFNYVVNYNIPSYPYSLEQRFGRIDRIIKNRNEDSYINNEIHMVYLLPSISYKVVDTNLKNFYCATFHYLTNLITYFPSKNTILNHDILYKYVNTIDFLRKKMEELKTYINNDSIYRELINKLNNDSNEEYSKEVNELYEFCLDFDFDDSNDNIKKSILEVIEKFNAVSINDFRKLIKYFKDFGNNIFYCNNDYNKIINSNEKSLGVVIRPQYINSKDIVTYILNNKNYIEYSKYLNEKIKPKIVFNKYSDKIEEYFEEVLFNNDEEVLNVLFRDSYSDDDNIKLILGNDYEYLKEYIDKLLLGLPRFKMLNRFKESINEISFKKDGERYYKFYFNPFRRVVELVNIREFNIKNRVINENIKENNVFLSSDNSKLFKELDVNKIFYFYRDEENIIRTSIWLKLFYYFSKDILVKHKGVEVSLFYYFMFTMESDKLRNNTEFGGGIYLIDDTYIGDKITKEIRQSIDKYKNILEKRREEIRNELAYCVQGNE